MEEKHSSEKLDFISKIKNVLLMNPTSIVGPSYQSMNKQLADVYLTINEELKAVYHLTEAHAATLRQQTVCRYDHTEDLIKNVLSNTHSTKNKVLPVAHGIRKEYVGFSTEIASQEENGLLLRLREMPKEWTVIQLTRQSQLEPAAMFRPKNTAPKHTGLFITKLPCGASLEECMPITVEIPAPENDDRMPTLFDLLNQATHQCLRTKGTNPKEIRKAREKASELIKDVITDMNNRYLREWRCLLLGSLINCQYAEQVRSCIDDVLINNQHIKTESRSRQLLYCVTSGAAYLSSSEIKSAVSCLVTCKHLYSDLVRAIEVFKENSNILLVARRYPVILILDEELDSLPWEMLPLLKKHPVSRIPSIHFLHALFHEHKDYIVGGCRMVSRLDLGFYIVNPDQDLKDMENRLVGFLEKRMPDWRGIKGKRPSQDEFGQALVNNNIFLYCGHFNGSHILSPEEISSLRVVALPLLFGCSSVALQDLGGRASPTGVSDKYIMAGSPCVIGMLWTVTSDDTDCMTVMLLNSWLPGQPLDMTGFRPAGDMLSTQKEPELLRLLRYARETAHLYSNAAALIARGLPILITDQ